jgi:hypothetical protein
MPRDPCLIHVRQPRATGSRVRDCDRARAIDYEHEREQ